MQINNSIILITSDTKKNATIPIKIVTGILKVAKLVIAKANALVIIAPIELAARVVVLIQSQIYFGVPKIIAIKPISPRIPKIKVIYINTDTVVTRPI